MKKVFLIAIAMLIACTTIMAQPKKSQTKKGEGQPSVITLTSDGQKAESPEIINGRSIELPPAEVGLDVPLRHALDKRRTVRQLSEEEIPIEMLSSLLWSTYGYNRPDEQRRVVPSARNAQEFDIYVFMRDGIYLYNAEKNVLEMINKEDHRTEISDQKHFAEAYASIVIVANYDRMQMFKEKESRDFYAAVDAGYISQNIYLFCSANDLGTVACGAIDRDAIQKIIGFKNGRAILAHPIGFAR